MLTLTAGILTICFFILPFRERNKDLPRVKEIVIPVLPVDLLPDPHLMQNAPSMMISLNVFRGLFRYLPDGSLKPDLVKSWREDRSGINYTFTLKSRAFADGTPITAKNVQMSFARMFFLKSSMAADLSYIKGAHKFQRTGRLSDLGIRVSSPYEIEFELSHPSSLFIRHLAVADCAVLNLSDFKVKNLDHFQSQASGPYKIEAWTMNEIKMKRWRSDDFDSKNPPDIVIVRRQNFSTLVSLALKDKVDTLDSFHIDETVSNRLRDKGWRNTVTEVTRERFLVLNPESLPTRIRAEMFFRINSEAVIQSIGIKSLKAAWGLIPDGMAGALSREERVQAFAGHRHGVKLYVKPVTLLLPKEMEGVEALKNYLDATWADLFSKLNIRIVPAAKLFELGNGPDSQIKFGARGIDYPDGISVLNYFRSNFDGHIGFLKSRRLDQRISNLTSIRDSNERIKAYKEAQISILKSYTVIPLMFGSGASGLWSSEFKSVPPHPMGAHTIPFEILEMQKQ
jgi:ABC-type oligopeptide transport system substrate-binding subunit